MTSKHSKQRFRNRLHVVVRDDQRFALDDIAVQSGETRSELLRRALDLLIETREREHERSARR